MTYYVGQKVDFIKHVGPVSVHVLAPAVVESIGRVIIIKACFFVNHKWITTRKYVHENQLRPRSRFIPELDNT